MSNSKSNNQSKRKRQDPPRVETPYNPGVESPYKLTWWKKILHAINLCPTALGQDSKKVVVQEKQAEGEACPTPIDCDIFYNFMLSETKLSSDITSQSFQKVYFS